LKIDAHKCFDYQLESRLSEVFGSDDVSSASESVPSDHGMGTEEDPLTTVDLISGKPPSGVLIDTAQLAALLRRAVQITENQSVRALETLHAELSAAIKRFEHRADRRGLPKVR